MKELLQQASEAYYKGEPFMSDAAFDVLSAHFNISEVGHQVTDGIPHFYRMYSLQKVFDIKDAPLVLNDCIETPKLDGAAVSLLYVAGKFSLGLTRGDGILGRDITEKLKMLVPDRLSGRLSGQVIQITGEVVAPKSIPNARNYAAGALNLKDIKEFITRDLTFVAYNVEGIVTETYFQTLRQLTKWGFIHVGAVDSNKYPTDGSVYRLNSESEFRRLGYTDKHPRGAFALKTQAKGIVTKLLDVKWQVGKSGVVSPVAILEPVLIADAVVSRATLHNMKYINDLGLEIGCEVEVIRSGEIIPRVVRRVDT